MSRPKMTETHRVHVQNQILDRANAILIEKGPENISSRAIAQNIGLTHMGLYTYFPNQAAILDALVEREQRKAIRQLQVFKTRAEKEDIAQILQEGLAYLQTFSLNTPNLFRLTWMESGAVNSFSQQSWLHSIVDVLAEVIQKGMDQGIFYTLDPQSAALIVLGLVNMPFVLACSGKISCPEQRDKISQEALHLAMRYLRTGIKSDRSMGKMPDWLNQLRRWFRKIL